MLADFLALALAPLLPGPGQETPGPGPGPAAGTGTDTAEPSTLQDLWFDEPFLHCAVIVVGSFVAAKTADVVVVRLLRFLASRSKSLIDDQIVRMVRGPVVATVVLVGIAWALEPFEMSDSTLRVARLALLTLALLLWMVFGLRATSLVLRAASRSATHFTMFEERTFPLFDNLIKLLLFGGAFHVFLTLWDIDAGPLLASAGILGIALGFAAKDTLANFFSGVFIIADAPYRVGDYITIQDVHRGRVEHIGLRSTRLLTRDDVELTIPNSIVANSMIINEAGGPSPRHRIRVAVGVAYGSDLKRVSEVLMQIAADADDVCKEPEPRVRFRSFGDSGLLHELLCWIPEPELRGRVLHALNTAVHDRFMEAGIEIPYPKRDVILRPTPPPAADAPVSAPHEHS